MRALGALSVLASVWFVALDSVPAQADGVRTTAPAMAVDGHSLYVASGGVQQFRLSASGPVWLRGVPTNGPATSVVRVPGDDGVGASGRDDGVLVRLGVTGEFTLTVFEANGIDAPFPASVRTWPAGELEERLMPPGTLGDLAVLGTRRYDGLYQWQATDLSYPITLEGLLTGFVRGPVATGWGTYGGRTIVSYNSAPLGAGIPGTLAILNPDGTTPRERFPAARELEGKAGSLLVHGGRAYVAVSDSNPYADFAPFLATVGLDDPTLPIRSRVEGLALTVAVGGLGLGLVDDRLVVSSLDDPDRPVEVASARLAGLGVDVVPVPGGTSDLGAADHAVALSESEGNLWLEVFRLSGVQTPLRIRTPLLVPSRSQPPNLPVRVYLPLGDVSEPAAGRPTPQRLGGGHRSAGLPAQPVPATATPVVPAGPPISLAGEWSITRTYWRSCPRCGTTIIRTTPWEITQSGADVRVDRGLRGVVTGSGPALLSLEGTESEGFGVQRFWYATLRVSPDGSYFEGAFNGSETIQNPCASDPPQVTCFVSAGWLRAIKVSDVPTPLPTPGPISTDTPTPRPIAPVPVSSPSAVATSVLDSAGARSALLPAVMSP